MHVYYFSHPCFVIYEKKVDRSLRKHTIHFFQAVNIEGRCRELFNYNIIFFKLALNGQIVMI